MPIFLAIPAGELPRGERTLDGDAIPRTSSRLGGLELGEVDLRVRDVVHEIGHEELRRQRDGSMICPSVNPASRIEARSESRTLPRDSIRLLAKPAAAPR